MSRATHHPRIDLHAFAEDLLLRAGGEHVENLLPAVEGRKRADIAFAGERVIVEVKSLTNDRGNDPAVQETMNRLIVEDGPALGGPIIFGQASVRLDKLPDKLARQAFRLLGNRVRREVGSANRQIRETVEDLRWGTGQGVVLFIVPPMKINLHLIGWAVFDAIRGGANSSINSLVMVECYAPDEHVRNLVVSHHSIAGVGVPTSILRGLHSAVTEVLGATPHEMGEDDFFRRYEIDPRQKGKLERE